MFSGLLWTDEQYRAYGATNTDGTWTTWTANVDTWAQPEMAYEFYGGQTGQNYTGGIADPRVAFDGSTAWNFMSGGGNGGTGVIEALNPGASTPLQLFSTGSVTQTAGAQTMTLTSFSLSTSVSTTAATSSDIVLTNNSGTMSVVIANPASGTMSWQLLMRPYSGATGIPVLNGVGAAPWSNNAPYPIPAYSSQTYTIGNATNAAFPPGYSYYFSLTVSAGSGTATVQGTT